MSSSDNRLLKDGEANEVLKKIIPEFKHIDPHVIVILYAFIKRKELKKMNLF